MEGEWGSCRGMEGGEEMEILNGKIKSKKKKEALSPKVLFFFSLLCPQGQRSDRRLYGPLTDVCELQNSFW